MRGEATGGREVTPEAREAVRAMRIYCADGAKALGPLLDRPRWCRTRREYVGDLLLCRYAAEATGDIRAMVVLTLLGRMHWKQAEDVWTAYHGSWDIGPDGEPRTLRPFGGPTVRSVEEARLLRLLGEHATFPPGVG